MRLAAVIIAVGCLVMSCKSSRQATSDDNDIVSVTAKAAPCFGACPIYEMTIHNNRSATYHAIRFNKGQEGFYKGTIKAEDYRQLIQLLQATNFTQLQDEYKVGITDMPGMDLEIVYHTNQVKKIHDYGARGTEALKAFYQFVSGLRESQQWEKQ